MVWGPRRYHAISTRWPRNQPVSITAVFSGHADFPNIGAITVFLHNYVEVIWKTSLTVFRKLRSWTKRVTSNNYSTSTPVVRMRDISDIFRNPYPSVEGPEKYKKLSLCSGNVRFLLKHYVYNVNVRETVIFNLKVAAKVIWQIWTFVIYIFFNKTFG